MVKPEKLERPLPHDDLMERAVLGAILAGHEKASEILDTIRPDDFSDDRHRRIAAMMLEFHAEGNGSDVLALHDKLTATGESAAVGGMSYMASLMDGVATKGDLLYVVRGLRRMATFRKAIHLAESIKEFAFEQGASAEQVLDSAIEKFSSLARDLESTEDDGKPYFDSATAALSTSREGARLKIYTDIQRLDEWIGGFREQELVTITAETGTGKSLLAAQIRARACRDGFHTLFCSGEMSAAQLASRELASVAGVAPIKMRRDDLLTKEDFTALVEAAAHTCKQCRILDGELDLPRIRRAARKMKARAGLDLVILDYDELIDAEGTTEFEQQRVIARAAKSLAVELKCVVILISQLRKAMTGEDAAKPSLQRLYGSGAKQKHSSFIILADRPFVRELKGDEKKAKLWLLKSRDGRVGKIQAVFNIKSLRFEQAKEKPSEARVWHDNTEPEGKD